MCVGEFFDAILIERARIARLTVASYQYICQDQDNAGAGEEGSPSERTPDFVCRTQLVQQTGLPWIPLWLSYSEFSITQVECTLVSDATNTTVRAKFLLSIRSA